MTYTVAVSGGIGSGKTTVANLFHDHYQIDIVDADIIAREVVAQGSKGLYAIEQHFGAEALNQDGTLNRSHLRTVIFSHPEEKKWLDDTLHPLIRQEMQKQLNHVTSPYALLVVPLLVENQLQSMADRVLIVDVNEETQIQRTLKRDESDETVVRNILKAQATREQRLAVADDVINNDQENVNLMPKIAQLHQKYLAMSANNL